MPSECDAFSERVLKDVEKDYGKNIIVSGSDAIVECIQSVPWSPTLDVILSGPIEEGSWVGLTGNEKVGKAQPLHSQVYTPTGPVPIGSLSPGDDILTADGGVAKVTGVYPQGVKDIYRVTFIGGDSVECCEDHLWEVKGQQRQSTEVLPLRTIMSDLYEVASEKRPKWNVRLPKPLQFTHRKVPVSPYLLGLLLGDGGLTTPTPVFTNTDADLVAHASKAAARQGCHLKQCHVRGLPAISYRFAAAAGGRSPGCNPLTRALRELQLMGVGSHVKKIPSLYLLNSVKVRLGILRGLMDTDGTVDKNGNVSFCSVSKQLAEDVKFLVESLGMLCRITHRETASGKGAYTCFIRSNKPWVLFRLRRKRARCRRHGRPIRRRIASVEKVGVAPAVCISTSAADGLYLTDHCVVTHNTTLALGLASQAQKPEYGGRTVYYGKVEGRLSMHHLQGIKGLDLTSFRIIQSTKDRILSAQDYLKIFLHILKTEPRAFLIIDSISSLVDEAELNEGVGTETRGRTAKLFSQWCRLAANVVPVQKSIVVGITHLIANTSGMGSPFMERAARMWKYQCDYQLRAKEKKAWKDGNRQIGLEVSWVCNTSKNGPPGMCLTSYLRFGTGIDRLYELMKLGQDTGLIRKSGTWQYLDFLVPEGQKGAGTAPKAQGDEKLCALLRANPEWAAALEREVLQVAGGCASREVVE